jgi:hypothetical protein
MAKFIIAGSAIVLKSSVKFEELKTVEKYNKNALALTDPETNEVYFAIGTTTGKGNINQFGVSFDTESRDTDKVACLTLEAPAGNVDLKEWIADKVGPALGYLNKIEETIPAALEKIAESRNEIMQSIEIV